MSTRRELLRLGTMAGAAALLPMAALADGRSGTVCRDRPLPPKVAEPDSGYFLHRSLFTDQIEGFFTVLRPGQRSVGLRLDSVTDPPGAPLTSGPEDCFSAVFRGPLSAALPQGTYSVRNDFLGTFELFLVPVGRPGRTRYYEASFNRLPV